MTHAIVIPRLGWSMEEGTFVGWLKKEGDYVRPGEPLFELEGEKSTQEIEAVDEGTLRIDASSPRPGSVLKVGAVIGYLATAADTTDSQQTNAPNTSSTHPRELTESPSRANFSSDNLASPVAAPSVRRLARELSVSLTEVEGSGRGGRILAEDVQRISHQAAAASESNATAGLITGSSIAAHSSPPSHSTTSKIASPRARRVAAELKIDWRQLTGSGAGGRIRECDVRAAHQATHSGQCTPASATQVPISKRRRAIAVRMITSRQQTVPVTITSKADASNLVNLREQFKSVPNVLIVPSYQDIITKLVAETLKSHLLLAGQMDEDAIVLPGASELHIGIAVDTPDGLLVPVIPNCGQSTLTEIASRSRELIAQARAGSLTASNMQGGIFTITNLGSFGIDFFTPVINYPETAILGLGAIRQFPSQLDNGQIVFKPEISLSLTFDHRLIDGAPAARFLQAVALAIANPTPWLCGS